MTAAVEARAIQAPLIAGQQVGTLTITKLIPSGTRVKKGDLLVEFDRQAQLRDSIDKQAQADDLNQQVIEAQAKEDAARAKDESEIHQAQDNLSKAKLEMEKVELLSRIDAEKAQEDLDEAKATLAQLKQTFDLKRKAAQASIRILEIQRDRARETMLHAQANSALMEIHSPIDGIVVFNTIWKQGNMGEVQEGDQVRPGVPFMQVVDPAIMEVRVPVNQEDLLGLKIGEKALVHLDAYADLVFPAQSGVHRSHGHARRFLCQAAQFLRHFFHSGSRPEIDARSFRRDRCRSWQVRHGIGERVQMKQRILDLWAKRRTARGDRRPCRGQRGGLWSGPFFCRNLLPFLRFKSSAASFSMLSKFAAS